VSRSLDNGLVPSGWRAVLALVAAVLVVLGVGVLIARAAGFAEVRDAIERADSRWFAVCLGAQVLVLGAYTAVVRGALRWRGRPDPGLRLGVAVVLASVGAARVFLAGGVGAIAVTYWCFRRAGLAVEEALVRVLGLNLLFYVPFSLGAWTAAALAVTGVWGDVSLAVAGPWLVLVPVSLAAAAWATGSESVDPLTRLEAASGVRRALGYVVAGAAWVREVLPDRAGRRLLVATALYWVGNVLCLWASLRSVGIELPLPELFLAYATGHVVAILPLPLGGVGGVDAAMTFALSAVGVALAPALVAVGVFRLFAFWAPTVPALVALLLLPRTGRDLARLAPSGLASS
jgi:uncharacterized membrane protein YbhN (UPF0104 family)